MAYTSSNGQGNDDDVNQDRHCIPTLRYHLAQQSGCCKQQITLQTQTLCQTQIIVIIITIIIIVIIIIIILVTIIIIAFKDAIQDFLQSPHCAVNHLQRSTWPRCNHVQITCNTSSAYHVQHVVLCAMWYKGTAQVLRLTEFKYHLF